MKIKGISVAVICLLGIASTAAIAAPGDSPEQASSQKYSHRGQLVYDIVRKWGVHVQETYGMSPTQWAEEMAPLFAGSELNQLQAAANARSFEGMNDALLGKEAASTSSLTVSPASIGETTTDLVYTPVPPCRLFDTRVAGGVMTPGSTRNFDVNSTGNFTGQGGAATNCVVGALNHFGAAVINMTVVGTTANGFLTAYALNTTRPLASSLNWAPGYPVSNEIIVPLDQTGALAEMSVFVGGSQAHVIGDIVGYFREPDPTALQCVEAAGTAATRPASGTVNAFGGVCPATYTLTGGECNTVLSDSVVTDEDLVGVSGASQSYNCQVSDLVAGGAADTITAVSRCCRIPGATSL